MAKIPHDKLQAMVNRHRSFDWFGVHSRRERDHEMWILSAGEFLAATDPNRKVFEIRASADRLAYELRLFLLKKIGEAVCYTDDVSEMIARLDFMSRDVRQIDEWLGL